MAHSTVPTVSPDRIISPPMVGVPFLVSRCDCGPSARIGWPLPWRMRKWSMIQGPNRNTNRAPVTTAPPVRKVM